MTDSPLSNSALALGMAIFCPPQIEGQPESGIRFTASQAEAVVEWRQWLKAQIQANG
jgi:hypothetical protein